MNITETIKGLTDLACLSPASEEDISAAEAELGLSFADDYKEYVKMFGAISASGVELTGVVPFPRLSVVEVTKRERESNEKIPSDMYVIENTGMEGLVILQTCDGTVYSAVPHNEPKRLFASLSDYLKSIK